ncbi:MAG: bifunctional YncE family protein/alkaline phosphatase family protein [Candidatus Sumerlaeaceae bacterium]|nr:bifunctional YncE family protein/alkaline phosphatase family protein [Candidatus Sumerlaeaceae bacterium]
MAHRSEIAHAGAGERYSQKTRAWRPLVGFFLLIVLGCVLGGASALGAVKQSEGVTRGRRERRIELRRMQPVRVTVPKGKLARPATPPALVPEDGLTTGVQLPNQWRITPVGATLDLGDLPLTLAMAPSRRSAVVVHAGFGDHEVRLIDTVERRMVSRAIVPNTWVGAAFDPTGKELYLSGGTDDILYVFPVRDGQIDEPTTVPIRADALTSGGAEKSWYVSGVAVDAKSGKVFLACQNRANLMVWDPRKPKVLPREVVRFAEAHAAPYKVVIHPKRAVAYVSLWGAKAVAVVNLRARTYRLIPTHSHPNELVISPDGQRLFVACANTNFTDVIDLKQERVVEHLDCAIYPSMPAGATPNGLALSPDGTILLVANADTNHLAVFDVSRPNQARSLGMIPTGWYPTAVGFGAEKEILVVNGKGGGSTANAQGPNPYDEKSEAKGTQYIAGLLKGTLSFVSWPSERQMARYTAQVLANSPLRTDLLPPVREESNPIPAKVGDPSPIRYCVYIVKENRTYDQVLGDLPEGNGDASLCLFGEQITPNHHALAREFILFDNFYVESEVSADGHEWSMGAYATDFVEKTWPSLYGGHGKHTYPGEGHHPMGRPEAGHIWNRAKEAGVSYYSYGEWVNGGGKGCNGTTKDRALRGHFDPCYSGFDMNVSDLDRTSRFIQEVKRYEREGWFPRLVIVRLPNDHTAGTRAGKPTPRAYVAENDLALGKIVERLSHSKFWKEMAIFVVEDDAQNGPDHVDAHRTVAFVVSPYAKRRMVCHTMYSTASMLRTMELILGLKPMSQFDAAARPLYEVFTNTPDYTPYKALPATWPLDEKNPPHAPMQRESAALNLEAEDSNPDLLFNEIIWKSVRGADSVMPPPVRAAFVRPVSEGQGD